MHNFYDNYHADAKLVTSEDSLKFKNFMNSDKVDYNMTKPARPMYYDREFLFMKDRSFWLRLLLLTSFAFYMMTKVYVERDRWVRWNRVENLEDMPAHHFNNRGGILVMKQFVGFEKIHKNRADIDDWYKKAYPSLFIAK